MTDDDECPALPEDTMRILNEFLAEKARQEQLEELPPQEIEENWQVLPPVNSLCRKDEIRLPSLLSPCCYWPI